MRRTIIYFIIFISSVQFLSAQVYIESPYTRFGVGDLVHNVSSRNLGMGGLSYTVPSSAHINYLNPAALAHTDSLTFIFDFGLNGGLRQYSIDNPPTEAIKSNLQISHLLFAFRITDWWATGFGVLPYSNVSYDMAAYDSIQFDVNKYYRFAGDGGLNRVLLNNAFTPVNNLNIGLGFSYIYGNINRNSAINFDDDSGDYLNILERNTVSVHDFMLDFGIQYSINLNQKNLIRLGGVYNYNSDLTGTKSTYIFNSLASGGSAIIDTIYASENHAGSIIIPQKIGFGLSYEYDGKFIFGVDYTTQNWSKAKFFGISDSLNNSNQINIGLEYTPVGKTGYAHRYSQAVSYRAGFHFNNTYLNVNSNNDEINDFGISFGFGLPLKRSQTSFNLAVQLGQRGTVRNDLIKENYIIFAVGFNLADRWFVKRRFD
jgi:hypothetical protein